MSANFFSSNHGRNIYFNQRKKSARKKYISRRLSQIKNPQIDAENQRKGSAEISEKKKNTSLADVRRKVSAEINEKKLSNLDREKG